MTHPEDALAGYVDGTLPPAEGAAVDRHLAGCARCRDEIALASGARAQLAALPQETPPAGLAAQALDEARAARAKDAAEGPPRWYRFAGIAAAAAAVLVVLTVALPRIGGHPGSAADKQETTGAGAVSGPARALDAATTIEIQHTNYDTASLSGLAGSYGPQEGGAVPAASGAAVAGSGTPQQTHRALTCIVRSAPQESGQLIRLIKARFEGAPAYFAVFLEGPGAGQPADAVTIWVFGTSDCAILSYSNARL